MNNAKMNLLSKELGDAFYLLNSEQFKKNFCELKSEFEKFYPNINIAYSYKTNYIPKLCKIVNQLGGLAEVVSDMELEIALNVGVKHKNIIWNGPYKNPLNVEDFLINGGTINLDSLQEFVLVQKIANDNPESIMNLGIRCNFDIEDGVVSRFGFDINSDEFSNIIDIIKQTNNLKLKGIHCHFATRSLETWKPRAIGMLNIIERYDLDLEFLDLGGGLFGKMADSLKAQFDTSIPTYKEYAEIVVPIIADYYKNMNNKPLLLIEPGSALVGDCMSFISKVISIKNIRGKFIATLKGSIYNINPTLNKKNPPIEIINMGSQQSEYLNLDFGGFTCIESDYLYKGFDGKLAENDFVLFNNVGSYSIVLKPPFILPNFPIIELKNDNFELIKKGETFNDIFNTYVF